MSLSESEQDNREILRHLEYLGHPIQSERVNTPEELREKLKLNHWTVVFCMSNLSCLSPREALLETKKYHSDLPFILISNGIGEEEVADMMKAGAEDVVLMSRIHRLLQVVRRVLRESEARDKEAKASKIAHQAYAAREQMLAVVSHDIKNPLSAIQLEAQMLLKVADRHGKTLLSEEVKIQANRILKTTERLKCLIMDLLDKNKSEEGLTCLNRSESNLAKLFQEVFDFNRPLIRQKEILVKTHFPDSLSLAIDKSKMFQVLSNLMSNAIKFTPVGGEMGLAIEETDADVVFSISDNGPGLKKEEIARVFEKYWTGNVPGRSGTGLGLFICKTIVEAHGGTIMVNSCQEKGTKFFFTIPKLSTDVQPISWVKDKEQKILIIDDDDDLREVISWALSKEGFAVHTYSDPRIALESLKKGRHLPRLMVVDFHMDGMKGSEFIKLKREIDNPDVSHCPVVMISASPSEVQAESDSEMYNEILPKPLDLEALMMNIKKYMR